MRRVRATLGISTTAAAFGLALVLAVPALGQGPSVPPSPSTLASPTASASPEPCPSAGPGQPAAPSAVPSPFVAASPLAAASPSSSTVPDPCLTTSADTPLSVIVADSGFSFTPGQSTDFAVILSNPNTSRWVALPRVSIDLLNKSGKSIGNYPASVTILPGGQAAVAGSIQDDKKTASMSIEIVPSTDGRAEWTEIDYEPGVFAFSKVKNKKGPGGRATTTGRISSTFANAVESVGVNAVYRNKAGDIIGGQLGVVDTVPAGGDASFKIESFIPFSRVATTEIYAAPSYRGPEFAK